MDSRTPVTILTGFLGSGKTTVLNATLRDPTCPRVGVVINEFGEIGIDHDLVEASSEEVVLLAGGCACCAVRSDLADALERLSRVGADSEERPFDRIVIETSGLADPSPIEALFLAGGPLEQAYRLESIIATVEATLPSFTPDENLLWESQVGLAHRILITKSDLATGHERIGSLHRIDAVNPSASRMIATRGATKAAMLFVMNNALPRPASPARPVHHEHDDTVRAFGLRIDRAISAGALEQWLNLLVESHGPRLLRLKGIVHVDGYDQPLAVHAVRHFAARPELLPRWPSADRGSRIAFVTRGLEPLDLTIGLDEVDDAIRWV